MIRLSDPATILLDAAVWTTAGIVVGYVAHRLPHERLAADGRLTRLRRFERGGDWYQRVLRIRAWKDRLPEAGALFPGGISKRSLQATSSTALDAFARETRRAEFVHWSLLAIAPCFALWNRPTLAAAMFAYAMVANVPFIAVQRFNRARIVDLGHRRSQRQCGSTDHKTLPPPHDRSDRSSRNPTLRQDSPLSVG